jgi:FAD-linked sulfhydryl oxidase
MLYPCRDCGEHFTKLLEEHPPENNNDSRVDTVLYACVLHNKVNERLNKPIFDCQRAMEYWGGDCGCGSKS